MLDHSRVGMWAVEDFGGRVRPSFWARVHSNGLCVKVRVLRWIEQSFKAEVQLRTERRCGGGPRCLHWGNDGRTDSACAFTIVQVMLERRGSQYCQFGGEKGIK